MSARATLAHRLEALREERDGVRVARLRLGTLPDRRPGSVVCRPHSEGSPAPVLENNRAGESGWDPFDDPKHVRGGRYNPHRRVPSIRAKESNNRIERFHGTEKERFKVMRAFDGEPGTQTLADGLRVHYNLVRDHQALGMTPGEAAGVPVGDGFRWRKIIEEASRGRSDSKQAAKASGCQTSK